MNKFAAEIGKIYVFHGREKYLRHEKHFYGNHCCAIKYLSEVLILETQPYHEGFDEIIFIKVLVCGTDKFGWTQFSSNFLMRGENSDDESATR